MVLDLVCYLTEVLSISRIALNSSTTNVISLINIATTAPILSELYKKSTINAMENDILQ